MTSLTVNVDRLASTVEKVHSNLSSSIERSEANLREDIRVLAADGARAKAVNWGWLIGAGSLMVVVVAAVGKGYIDPIVASQRATDRQTAANADDLRDIWHEAIPVMRERLARIEEAARSTR